MRKITARNISIPIMKPGIKNISKGMFSVTSCGNSIATASAAAKTTNQKKISRIASEKFSFAVFGKYFLRVLFKIYPLLEICFMNLYVCLSF